jgi:putative transposase
VQLQHYGIQSSMAKEVYENPNAEKINDTIKNGYLIPWGINSKTQLELKTPIAIEYYNSEKPHDALKLKTPIEFEITL